MESLVQFTGSYFSKFGMWQPSGEINKTQCNGSRRGGEGGRHIAESPEENADHVPSSHSSVTFNLIPGLRETKTHMLLNTSYFPSTR